MNHPNGPRPSSSLLSLGMGAVLALGAYTFIGGEGAGPQTPQVDRYQIRVVTQSAGAIGVVMVDSMTGKAWAQRLTPGLEAQPWLSLGEPK